MAQWAELSIDVFPSQPANYCIMTLTLSLQFFMIRFFFPLLCHTLLMHTGIQEG